MSTTPTPSPSSLSDSALTSFPSADAIARRIVSSLNEPRAAVYWIDFLLSAGLGWAAFAAALTFPLFSWPMVASAVISALALYRGLCFMHELSHLRRNAAPGFETAWNFLLGVPMLMPSFMYVGVHQTHHKLSTYGTSQDPEYLPFSGHRLMIAVFSLQSLLLPLFLVVRFVLLAPAGLLLPRLHTWLAVHASAFSMNIQYRRESTPELLKRMALWEAAILGLCGALALLAWRGEIGWRFFVTWYAITAVASFINALRTLGAHRYGSDGTPLDREGQLADSLDTPGAFWTELWAPVGLRYHALHHYFPGIPYHNLKTAHRQLTEALRPEARYRKAASPSLPFSLRSLWRGIKG